MDDFTSLLHMEKKPVKWLEKIMSQYSGLVYAISYGKLNSICSSEDIEELVSDIFLSFYNNRVKIDLSKGSIKSYLMIIANRMAISKYRATVTQGKPDISLDDENDMIDRLTSDDDLQSAYLKAEERKKIFLSIKALGEPDSEIIIRRYFLNQKIKEIACNTKLSEEAVRKRISRALNKLNSALRSYYGY